MKVIKLTKKVKLATSFCISSLDQIVKWKCMVSKLIVEQLDGNIGVCLSAESFSGSFVKKL